MIDVFSNLCFQYGIPLLYTLYYLTLTHDLVIYDSEFFRGLIIVMRKVNVSSKGMAHQEFLDTGGSTGPVPRLRKVLP